MTIKISLPESQDKSIGVAGRGTTVFNDEGAEIGGITTIDIKIRPDEIVTATVNIHVKQDTDMDNVHALLGTETLEQIAELHECTMQKSNIDKSASINLKVDTSEIDSVCRILDLIEKYKLDMPQGFIDEASELVK